MNETRDIIIPQKNPHSIPYIPVFLQLHIKETPYPFQIPAVDYTTDHLYSRATRVTRPYDFWFKKISISCILNLASLNLTK